MDWKAKVIIKFSDSSVFPIFIFILKLDANFPGLRLKSAYFLEFINFFGFNRQKNTLISTMNWKLYE